MHICSFRTCVMCEAMEEFLWKRFVHEVKPAIGNDLQQAATQNADDFSFQRIPYSRFLFEDFDQFKGRVKSAENFLLLHF